MYIRYILIYIKYSAKYMKYNVLSIYVIYVTFVDRTRIVNMFPTTPITPTRLCKLEIWFLFSFGGFSISFYLVQLNRWKWLCSKTAILLWCPKIRLKLDEVFTSATPSNQNEQVSPISMISSETVAGVLWCILFSFPIFTFWAFWPTVKIPARL